MCSPQIYHVAVDVRIDGNLGESTDPKHHRSERLKFDQLSPLRVICVSPLIFMVAATAITCIISSKRSDLSRIRLANLFTKANNLPGRPEHFSGDLVTTDTNVSAREPPSKISTTLSQKRTVCQEDSHMGREGGMRPARQR